MLKDKLTLKLEEAWKVMETTSSMPPGFESLVGDLNELPSEEEFNGVGIAEAALDDAPVKILILWILLDQKQKTQISHKVFPILEHQQQIQS